MTRGQGTCMAEWEDQGLETDTVLIAVGGADAKLLADGARAQDEQNEPSSYHRLLPYQ